MEPYLSVSQGKFINMSNKHLRLYWEEYEGSPTPHLIRHYPPMSAGKCHLIAILPNMCNDCSSTSGLTVFTPNAIHLSIGGTATFPGHRFFFTPDNDPSKRLIEFVIREYPDNLYVYDPYTVPGDVKKTNSNLRQLNRNERSQFDTWMKTLRFNEQYFNTTGRTYLANYLRPRPMHYMWPAHHFGQEHWVTSSSTHFDKMPPSNQLDPITEHGKKRILIEDGPKVLSEYRSKEDNLNMTLKVLSCAPRVFEIPNFLSQVEVDHILRVAGTLDLKSSTTGDVGSDSGKKVDAKEEKRRKTRTSFNSWVAREQSPIIDAVYRRAADLMRIDEALLRHRDRDEFPDVKTKKPLCESLQLVNYQVQQGRCEWFND